jgi:hypothetical protein
MITNRSFAAYLLGAILLFGTVPAWTQSTPDTAASQDSGVKQDLKTAGHDTKDAAKDTGHAVKQGTKKSYHATKNGTKKVWHKTKNTTKGAAEGAKEGAKQPQ